MPLPPSPAAEPPRQSTALGILAMTIAVGCLASMGMFIKLVGPDYSPFQATFLRNSVAAAMVVPMILWTGGTAAFKTQNPWGHAARSFTGVLGNASFFQAYALIPLVSVSAVAMSVPIFATLFAIVYLKEKVGIHRWGAIIVGFIGVLVALNPGGNIETGSLFALLGVICWAMTIVMVKRLSTTESAFTIVFYYMIAGVLVAGCIMPFVWITPPWEIMRYYLAAGVVGGMGQILMTLAIRLAPASVVIPFEYTAILWAVSYDLLLWGNTPGGTTILGAGIVIVTGLYIARRETRQKEQ